MGWFSRVYMWMRHGTRGHVAAPHGRMGVPTWHDVTCISYICVLYYGYLTYKPFHRGISLTANIGVRYIRVISHDFLRVGLCSRVFFDCRTRGATGSVGSIAR